MGGAGDDGTCSGGIEIRENKRRSAVLRQTEYEAEEPNPAPIGRLERAVNANDGLRFA